MNGVAGIVLAAGMGDRVGLGPKAFFELNGKSLMRIATTLLSAHVDRVLVGVPDGYRDRAFSEMKGTAEIIEGGRTRFETICRLAERCHEEYVMLHEAARPFATPELVARVLEAGLRSGAAVAVTKSVSGVTLLDGGFVSRPLPKGQAYVLQTPQMYRSDLLAQGVTYARAHGLEDPNPYELLEVLGFPVEAVAGDEANMKITTLLDWEIARRFLASLVTTQVL